MATQVGSEPRASGGAARSTIEYGSMPVEDAFRALEASPAGLSGAQARERLSSLGPNRIEEERRNPALQFLLRYWGPMPWLLEAALALSFVLGHRLEGWIILALLTMNAAIGQSHARSSQKAVELLRRKLAVRARALRDGAWAAVDARELVPGDVIAVRAGDVAPADAKVLGGGLSVDESALTGESLPRDVRPPDVIYSASVVRNGESQCLVVNTAERTYFGRTAELVKAARPKSHQDEIMLAVVRYMMLLGLLAAAAVAAYAALERVPLVSILTFIVIFLLGAVPVALPAVMTIVEAVGAMELAGEGVLVTRLSSIEDTASVDVLCLDKTGTLTENRLSVEECSAFGGWSQEEVLELAALASSEESLDPIDLAVIRRARKTAGPGGSPEVVAFSPFDPSTKRSEAVVAAGGGGRFRVAKGAAQVVVRLCKGLDEAAEKSAAAEVEAYSKKGYRTLAVARSDESDPDALRLAGLIALADPPRADSRAMIEQAKSLGIKPLMLTGDNIAIAREIAARIGIGPDIVRGAEIDRLAAEEGRRTGSRIDGFAEIYPEDKYKIVKLLQSRGHMVGMTGDGVNDAPALRQAEVGIAVGGATDVANASASVVLTRPGLGVVIDAVKVSRRIYQRMLTWVINKVCKVMEFVGVLMLAFFWLKGIALSLLGMALLVFANDFVTISLATDNAAFTGDPDKWNVRNIILASFVPACLWIAEGLAVIGLGTRYFELPWERLRTLVLLNFVFNSQFRVLIVRERRHWWASKPGRNTLIWSLATIVAFGLLGRFGGIVPPISTGQVLTALGCAAAAALLIDLPKSYLFSRFGL